MRLPKFDSSGSLIFGTVFSLLLSVLNLMALVEAWRESFIPFQAAKILGMIVGVVLAVHCVDMMGYYRKYGRLRKDGDHRQRDTGTTG